MTARARAFMLGFAASDAGGRFRGVDSDADLAVAEEMIIKTIGDRDLGCAPRVSAAGECGG